MALGHATTLRYAPLGHVSESDLSCLGHVSDTSLRSLGQRADGCNQQGNLHGRDYGSVAAVVTHTNISRTCPTGWTYGSKHSTHTNIVLVVMQTGRLDVLEKSDALPDVYKSSAVCPLYGWVFRPVN